jgi:tetratricopeptide (TPR) repeat protein
MISRSVWGAAALVVVLGAAGSAAAESCQLQKMLEVPVVMQGLRPTVAAKINGHDVSLTVGTGGFFSSVPSSTVAETGMTRTTTPYGLEVTGLGGRQRGAVGARAKDFILAGGVFHDLDFLVFEGGGEGQLGQNLMGPFDVEYDFANGVMRFFRAKDCGNANLAYWAAGKPVSRLNLEDMGKYLSKVRSHAKIDGREIRVEFSSGTGVSFLSRPAAARVGVKPSTEGVTPGGVIFGAYGKAIDSSIATFQSFAVGDEEVKNARLRVADSELNETDMMLGTDFFLSHRIMISNTQHKLYFTYNGGPVFQLERAGVRQAQAAPPAAEPGGAASTTTTELDAQGTALTTRRDFPAAIAVFGKAIEQDPNDAAAYRGRAMARLQNRQPALGMADLDNAIRLQPNDVETLLLRGRLLLQAKDLTRASADFDAALKAAPDRREVSGQVAAAWMSAGEYERAVRRYDAWFAAHPKDPEPTIVLTQRCNARAVWGHELDAALADCDQALKKGGKTSGVLENRGLVLLRLGRTDEAIAQFNAALGVQPKAAWALYGRGVAKARKGDKAGADADFAAAAAVRPTIAVDAKRYGLAPDGTVTGAAAS